MVDNARNYVSFIWHNRTIDNHFVNSVQVRIFRTAETVISDSYLQLVASNGDAIQKRENHHISNYSYVILSTGIHEKFNLKSQNTYKLYIKLYVTEDFDLSQLSEKDFLGKAYVIEAIRKYLNHEEENLTTEPVLPPMLKYLEKKVGADYKVVNSLLITSAYTYNYDKIEEVFKEYKISSKYQALFWKEMYQEIAKRR